jgi:hypothetical protein
MQVRMACICQDRKAAKRGVLDAIRLHGKPRIMPLEESLSRKAAEDELLTAQEGRVGLLSGLATDVGEIQYKAKQEDKWAAQNLATLLAARQGGGGTSREPGPRQGLQGKRGFPPKHRKCESEAVWKSWLEAKY